jgi:hypothetical protein
VRPVIALGSTNRTAARPSNSTGGRQDLPAVENLVQHFHVGRAAVEGRERDHADLLDRLAFRCADHFVAQVGAGDGVEVAVVVLDDVVLPDELRRSAEDRPAIDEALRDQPVEDRMRLRQYLGADDNL